MRSLRFVVSSLIMIRALRSAESLLLAPKPHPSRWGSLSSSSSSRGRGHGGGMGPTSTAVSAAKRGRATATSTTEGRMSSVLGGGQRQPPSPWGTMAYHPFTTSRRVLKMAPTDGEGEGEGEDQLDDDDDEEGGALSSSRAAAKAIQRSSKDLAPGTDQEEVRPGDDSENRESIDLRHELETSFMQYAMSIILGRALPDVRDGLKPVHRRILYAMDGLGLQPSSSHRKCARVVGEVLGKYHPHGDIAVYDAMVRMAQDFVMGCPLIDGHGNFGSIDNDPAAAMRYTEARLHSLARDALLEDLDLNTVDFIPNFDGNEEEPVVLPARLPVLLLNGASGIAVGMATNIPPHNLAEVVDATVAYLRNPDISSEELMKHVPAPDFPSGGIIMGKGGAEKLYTTSNGGVLMRAKTHIEYLTQRGKRDRPAIIVTEMPYQVSKSTLLEKIAAMVNDKKLDGISDLRDESDREGMRVVIELKRDAAPQVVMNNLFKKTQLQTSFSGNMLALGKGGKQPKRYTLKGLLEDFVDFRFQTITRRTETMLGKVETRKHIVEGMLLALRDIDAVIDLVRKSKDNAAAREGLMGPAYGLSTAQADAILGLRLGRLTSMEETRLVDELKDLSQSAETYTGMLSDSSRIYKVMEKEMLAIKKSHGVPRRTVIQEEEGDLDDLDLLENAASAVVVTSAGYIKRMPLEEFQSQGRGTRGKAGARMSDNNDFVKHFFTCQDHDTLLFVSTKGVAYGVRAYQVPAASRTAKGVPVPQVLPLSGGERISSVIPVSDFSDDEFLILMTKEGVIKRTALSTFKSLSARGLIIMKMGEGDELKFVNRAGAEDSVIIGTRGGYAIRFEAEALRLSKRTGKGVKAMSFYPGDGPVGMEVLPPPPSIEEGQKEEGGHEGDKFLLVMTAKGFGKRVASSEFKLQGRAGKGVISIRFKKNTQDNLECFQVVEESQEVLFTTSHGTIVRQEAGKIARQSRTATGVLVQRLDEGDSLASVAVVPNITKVEEEEVVKSGGGGEGGGGGEEVAVAAAAGGGAKKRGKTKKASAAAAGKGKKKA